MANNGNNYSRWFHDGEFGTLENPGTDYTAEFAASDGFNLYSGGTSNQIIVYVLIYQ